MKPGNPDLHEQGKKREGGAGLTRGEEATTYGAAMARHRSATRPSHRPSGIPTPCFLPIALHADRPSQFLHYHLVFIIAIRLFRVREPHPTSGIGTSWMCQPQRMGAAFDSEGIPVIQRKSCLWVYGVTSAENLGEILLASGTLASAIQVCADF